MPVLNASASADADWLEKYVGLVDMMDIAAFVISLLDEKKMSAKGYHGLAEENQKLATTTVAEIAGKSGNNPFVPLEKSSSLREAMVLMGKYHLYRLPIIDGDKQQLVNLLTQSEVVKLLGKNMKLLGSTADKTLKELGLGNPKKMQTVAFDAPAVSAFTLITKHRIGAVPVCGLDGTLVGNVSAKDIRAVLQSPEVFSALFKPVTQFLEMVHTDLKFESLVPAICCKQNATLRHVISMLNTSRIHRVYVVDDHNKLLIVVSLTDILGALVTEPEFHASQ